MQQSYDRRDIPDCAKQLSDKAPKTEIASPNLVKKSTEEPDLISSVLPPSAAQKAHKILAEGKGIIFFDSSCIMCSGAVHTIFRDDKDKNFYFSSLHSELAAALLKDYGINDPLKLETLILLQNGKVYLRSDAVLRIGNQLTFAQKMLSYAARIIPHPLRDAIYDYIARNRKQWFGEKDVCVLPEKGEAERYL